MNNYKYESFITYEIWTEAVKLLEYQISSTYNSYKKINSIYFRSIKDRSKFGKKGFYKKHVANNAFFGLSNDFFVEKYEVSKGGMGLRKFTFCSYPSMVLYYAIGIYIVRVAQEFIEKRKRINPSCRYGGDIRFSNNDEIKLIINNSTTLYYAHYSEFKREIEEYKNIDSNRFILKVDLQNYYEHVDIKILLEKLSDFSKHSEIYRYGFNSEVQRLISNYFDYLNDGNIIQGDNNVVSGALGHLYMLFGDIIIDKIIKSIITDFENINSYKVIRYVDDVFIVINFKPVFPDDKPVVDIKNKNLVEISKLLSENGYTPGELPIYYQNYRKQTHTIDKILTQIADQFYDDLKLRFNKKTDIYWFGSVDDINRFIGSLSGVSNEALELTDDKIKPKKKVKILLRLLERLAFVDISKLHGGDLRTIQYILKFAFDKVVNSILDSDKKYGETILPEKMKYFNFDLVKIYPQPIMILISKSKKLCEAYEEYIISQTKIDSGHLSSIVNYLSQTTYKNDKILKVLKKTSMSDIMKRFKFDNAYSKIKKGYFKVNINNIYKYFNSASYTEQIRLRKLAENKNDYSAALNHLLNELQSICCEIEQKDIKKYKANNVILFLRDKGVNEEITHRIENLFDRRNNNPLSHPGSETRLAIEVSQSQYNVYLGYVGKVFNFLFK